MASIYDSLLKLELMADGEKKNIWGQIANIVFQLLAEAIAGMETVSVTGAGTTLTATDGASDQSRNMILKFTGTLTSNETVIIPSRSHLYIVWNATTGSYTLTIKTSGGTGVVIPQGHMTAIFCDGTDTHAIGPYIFNEDVDGNGKTLSNVNLIDFYEEPYDAGNISGAVTLDFENGGKQKATATGNITGLTINNMPNGASIILRLAQDGTGGRTLTLSSTYKKTSAITLSTAASAVDRLIFDKEDSSNIFVDINKGYS